MAGLLTVEDYNSVNTKYVNEYYALDTSKISDQEFTNISYDFCIVSHSINGNNHTFTFQIQNSLWCGGYWFTKTNGEYIDVNGSYENNILTFTTSQSAVILHLYLCNFADRFNVMRLQNIITNENKGIFIVPINTENILVNVLNVKTGDEQSTELPIYIGVKDTQNFYLLCLPIKTDLVFNLNTDVTVGIVNHVCLNVDDAYLPDGELVDEDELDIIVKYGDLEIPVTYDTDLNDYCFDLDLTNKIDDKPIKITVQVNEIDVITSNTIEISLNCNYPLASNFSELQSQLTAGAEIIELTDNLSFTNNLIIPYDTYIIGDGFNINLSSYQIIIPDNVNLKLNNVNFTNGQSCFIQKNNTQLTLNNCKFTNAKITDNYKGSVISSNSETTNTTVTNCTFHNCHHTIYTGGNLNISNSRALYDDWNDSVDTDYSAFLTAWNGNIEITGSTFDIDYQNKEITDEKILYAQSLIGLSRECVFNGSNASIMDNNNTLPFFNNIYNNRSHIWIPYYYESIESIVVSSPTSGNEDRSVCHTILGMDWVFKNNVQVTNRDNANNIRKIDWSDI